MQIFFCYRRLLACDKFCEFSFLDISEDINILVSLNFEFFFSKEEAKNKSRSFEIWSLLAEGRTVESYIKMCKLL